MRRIHVRCQDSLLHSSVFIRVDPWFNLSVVPLLSGAHLGASMASRMYFTGAAPWLRKASWKAFRL